MARKFMATCSAILAALVLAPMAAPQVRFAVQIGPPPVCPYGYFDYAPYSCAPYGYYGPAWFPGGVFLGAGPWFHGGPDFRGHVDNRFDPRHGYRGPLPHRGERDIWENGHWRDHPHGHFHGNEMRDGRGHAVGHEHHGH